MLPLLLAAAAASAQEGSDPSLVGAPLESRAMEVVEPTEPEPDNGFSFLGLVQTRATMTDIATDNPFYNGQLVGQLGGSNSTVVLGEGPPAMYTEFRTNGFFGYAPPILDGKVKLNAGWEVDFSFGDLSYGTGGNTGGGFGADQVNLQTRRLNVVVKPSDWLQITLGQQFMNDGVYDPNTSGGDALFRSGGGLMFFGSEAAGITLHGTHNNDYAPVVRWRAGAFTLTENGAAVQDDVGLLMADLQWHPIWATTVGFHAWHLRDRSAGNGGAFGVGPTSALAELQGAARLDLRDDGEDTAPDVNADITWLVADAGYNVGLHQGPFGVRGLAAWNLGRMYVTGKPDVGISGQLFDVEARFRYTRGQGSVVRLEGLWVSADDADESRYTGIITGNSYGIVGSVYTTHGCVLLFQDLFSINRMTPVNFDISGQGQGMRAVTGSVGYDPIPDRLTVQVGGGRAVREGSSATEVNVRVIGEPFLFFNVGVTAATAFIEGERDPYMVYVHGDWLVF
ncbi:MAG: hypothetical protein VX899_10225 [Myxococcota bacterium]|nr:hypothetical protein [Myxococcota bacterium]